MSNYPTIGSVAIVDTKKLGDMVKSINMRSKNVTHDLHVAAVNLLWHASHSGDVTLVNKLWLGLGKGINSGRLFDWMTAHAPIIVKDKQTRALGLKKNWKEDDFDIEAAEATPFYEFKRDSALTTKGADKLLAEVMRYAENKARKDSDVPKFTDNAQELATLVIHALEADDEVWTRVQKLVSADKPVGKAS